MFRIRPETVDSGMRDSLSKALVGEWDGNMGLDLSIVWQCIVSVRGETSGAADFIAPL